MLCGERSRLLLHDSVMKSRRQSRSVFLCHSQCEGLRNDDGSDALPRFWHRAEFHRHQFLGRLHVVGCNQNYFASTSIAVLREFQAKFGRPSKGENDRKMRLVDVEDRAVTEACARVGCRALASHLANA